MSVTMTFYSGFSKRENSTKQPTGGTSYAVVFKDAFSIIGGTVKLQANFDTAKNYTAAKYGNNFYKVVDVVSTTNNIVEITLTLDVLATYKSSIAGYTCALERSPDNANIVNLNDNTIRPIGSYSVKSYTFPRGYSEGVCYQLTVISKDMFAVYFMDRTSLDDVGNKLESFSSEFLNLKESVVSCNALPISISDIVRDAGSIEGASSVKYITIGFNDVQIAVTGTCILFKKPGYIRLTNTSLSTSSLNLKYYDFRKYSNDFTKLTLRTGGQNIDIDSVFLRAQKLSLVVALDIVTLDLYAFVTATYQYLEGEVPYAVYTASSNLGMPAMFGISSQNLTGIISAITNIKSMTSHRSMNRGGTAALSDYTSTYTEGTNTSLNATLHKGLASSNESSTNLLGAAHAILEIPSSFSSTTVPTSSASVFAEEVLKADLYITEFDSTQENPDEVGYPDMRVTSINAINLSGYYKFAGPSIDIAAAANIKEAVNSYLANGFFYE